MIKFNKTKVATKIKLKESEEVLDNSIEKDIMEELGITDDDIADSDNVTSEEIDMADVDVTSDDELTSEDLDATIDDGNETDDSQFGEGEGTEEIEDITSEDEALSDEDMQLEDDVVSTDDLTETEESIGDIDLELEDLTTEDLEDDLSDVSEVEGSEDIQLEDELDNLVADDSTETEEEETPLTEEEIDAQIANLQAQKESLQKEGAEMVPAKVLFEIKNALKKMGIDFIKTKRANEAMRFKMNALVKENAILKLDEKKAEAVITLLAKAEIPKKGKYKIIESIDKAKTDKEVNARFNQISKLLAETTKNKTLNRITESAKSGAGKKVENAGISLREKYLLGISDEYLKAENYMK